MLSNESLNLKIHQGTSEIKDLKVNLIIVFTLKSYGPFLRGLYVPTQEAFATFANIERIFLKEK